MSRRDVQGRWEIRQDNGFIVAVDIQPLRDNGVFNGTATHSNGTVHGAGFGGVDVINPNEFTFTISWSNGTKGAYIAAFDDAGILRGTTFDVNNPQSHARWESLRAFPQFL